MTTECYGKNSNQRFIETDYSIIELSYFINKLSNYEPGILSTIIYFIIHFNSVNTYNINSLFYLITSINIKDLDCKDFISYSQNILYNLSIKKLNSINHTISKILEWYENYYMLNNYEKILDTKEYIREKYDKLQQELMINSDYSKLVNFDKDYNKNTLEKLKKRTKSIKLFGEFIKNNIISVKIKHTSLLRSFNNEFIETISSLNFKILSNEEIRNKYNIN